MKSSNKIILTSILSMIFMCGCTQQSDPSVEEKKGTRDNTPVILIPQATKEKVIGNDKITFDISNVSKGYVVVWYTGDNPKVKVQIQIPNDSDPYTYDIFEGENVFPLTGGSGSYTLSAFENIEGTRYSYLYTDTIEVTIENELSPFLYPNQYVNFNESTQTIQKAKNLVEKADTDLDAVSMIFEYVVNNISYDHDKAAKIQNGELVGYLPDVDEILEKRQGICFDYSAVMATMLRTQNIPTRMMIGYVSMPEGSLYHAWISVYIQEIGWVDNLIEFDGENWSMMDPTFISDGHNSSKIRDFTTNQENYLVKYLY